MSLCSAAKRHYVRIKKGAWRSTNPRIQHAFVQGLHELYIAYFSQRPNSLFLRAFLPRLTLLLPPRKGVLKSFLKGFIKPFEGPRKAHRAFWVPSKGFSFPSPWWQSFATVLWNNIQSIYKEFSLAITWYRAPSERRRIPCSKTTRLQQHDRAWRSTMRVIQLLHAWAMIDYVLITLMCYFLWVSCKIRGWFEVCFTAAHHLHQNQESVLQSSAKGVWWACRIDPRLFCVYYVYVEHAQPQLRLRILYTKISLICFFSVCGSCKGFVRSLKGFL